MHHSAHPADLLTVMTSARSEEPEMDSHEVPGEENLNACHHRPSGRVLHCGSACGSNVGFELLGWLWVSREGPCEQCSLLRLKTEQTLGWADNTQSVSRDRL